MRGAFLSSGMEIKPGRHIGRLLVEHVSVVGDTDLPRGGRHGFESPTRLDKG
jgi:hypothetical protein